MKTELVEYLICPRTQQPLKLSADQTVLETPDGQQQYPIVRGIPRLFSSKDTLTALLENNWGYKWETMPEFLDYHQKLFWDYIKPLEPHFFVGKTILDACCGGGVSTRAMSHAGARRVIGFDISSGIELAQRHNEGLETSYFVQTDLFDMPFQPGAFDVVVCMMALHHTKDPDAGLEKLKSRLKPAGTLVVWVYAYEGTAFVRRVVDPLRRVLNRIPHPALKGLAWFAAALLWPTVRCYEGVSHLSRLLPVVKRLPMYDYFLYVSQWPFYKVHEMVLDQLIAPITNYITQDRMEEWFNDTEFSDIHINWVNHISWLGIGTLKEHAQ